MNTDPVHIKHVDYTGSKMGMWIFLFTELLFFGGLFLLYAVYRSQYTQEFHTAADGLDSVLGAVNTLVLGLKANSLWSKFGAIYPPILCS